MSYEVKTIPAFDRAVKKLRRKYRRIVGEINDGSERWERAT
jgi:hypothetical protein